MHRSAWVLLAVLSWPGVASANDLEVLDGRGRVRADELLLTVRPGTSGPELRALERRAGVRIVEESTTLGVLRVEVSPGQSLASALGRLIHDPAVAAVSPNAIARAAQVDDPPDDPLFPMQWNLDLTAAWADGVPDATNVTVAIVDTGIAADAPDLAGVPIAPGWDYVGDDADTTDDHQHGTHIAGIVAQATDNGLGTAAVAPGATLMPVKVLDATATGDEFTILEGIAGAVADGADVINLSFEFEAGYVPSRVMEATVRDALDAGVVLVGAAGNGGSELVSYPAAFSGVIAVGAASLDADGNVVRAPYSNMGPELDVLGPGGNLDVDADGDGVPEGILAETFDPAQPGSFEPYLLEGTSGASAHVAGVAAILLAAGVPAADIENTILETATDLGTEGYDTETGAGLVTLAADEIPVPPKIVIPNAEVSVVRTQDGCSVASTATVTIRDQFGNVLPGSAVIGRWSGSVTQVVTALADADGVATIVSPALALVEDARRGGVAYCSVNADRGTLFLFSVGTVIAQDGSVAHPRGNHPDGWFSAWLRPGDGTQLWGAGLVFPPSGLDYVDARPAGVPHRMDALLLEPFGLVFGAGMGNDRNDLGRIRGAILNPYDGWVLPVHDVVEAESVLYIGGGSPDPSDDPVVEELDSDWAAFATGVAIFSHRGLRAIGGGSPDPSDLPGTLSVRPDAPVMLRAIADGELTGPPTPPATDAARLVPLSHYLP